MLRTIAWPTHGTAVLTWLMLASTVSFLPGCVSEPLVPEEKDVDYFSLGNVRLETPERRGNVVTIKLTLDARTWHEDAPRMVHHIYPVLVGRKIYFSVTSIESQGKKVANTVSFPITGVKTGRDYQVFYRDPNGASHVVGKVTIPEDPKKLTGRTRGSG